MRRMLVAAVLLAVALASAQAQQQMYRWVDKDGKVHYTQQPPPPDAKDIQRRTVATGSGESSDLPFATQLAAKNYPVTLYTSADCSACRNARESLEKRGIPFEEVVVGDANSIENLKRLTGKNQVPVLRVGTQVEVGFEAEGWKAALDAARYPASGPPARARIKAEAPKALPPVKLYTSPDCGGLCEEARSVLAARSVKFQEVEVSVSAPETLEELTKVAGNAKVPVLTIGQRVQRGFDAAVYHGLLDGAGFPRAAAPTGAAKR